MRPRAVPSLLSSLGLASRPGRCSRTHSHALRRRPIRSRGFRVTGTRTTFLARIISVLKDPPLPTPRVRSGRPFNSTATRKRVATVADSQSLRPLNAITIDAWINPSSASTSFQGVLFKGSTGSAGGQPYSLFVNGANHQVVVRIGNDSTFDALGSNAGLPANVYSHVAMTYDGTTIRIYINGTLDASQTTTIGTLAQANTQVLYLGGLGGSNLFMGAVDEIGIYNRALSQSEIQAIVNAGSAGKCKPVLPPPATACTPPPNGMAAWLTADGTGLDVSGNGNNGVLGPQTTFAAGAVGQAFQFNGTNGNASVVTVPDSPSLHITAALTIDAWVKPTAGDAIVLKGGFGGAADQPYGSCSAPSRPPARKSSSALAIIRPSIASLAAASFRSTPTLTSPAPTTA